jgi:hypothetical protein
MGSPSLTESKLRPSITTWDSWITGKYGIFPGRNVGQNDDVNRERPQSVTPMELEQRHIIELLHLKNLKLGDVAVELSNVYGQDAHPRSSIKYWLHQLKLRRKDLTTQRVGGRSPLHDTDTEILSVLRVSQFSLVRTIADSLSNPASTVYWH